jgi:hypothetical protein
MVTFSLHILVNRSPTPFGRYPLNDLIGIGDVARFAVNAIREIYSQSSRPSRFRLNHLVNLSRTEMLARVPKLLLALRVANVGHVFRKDDQMARLVFFVLGA